MTLFKGFVIIIVVIIISYLFPLISTHPSFTDISCHSKKFFSFPNFHCYIFCKSHDPLHILLNCYNNGSATFFFCTDSIPIKNPTSFQAIYHYNEARTLPSFKRRCFLSYLKLAQRVPNNYCSGKNPLGMWTPSNFFYFSLEMAVPRK